MTHTKSVTPVTVLNQGHSSKGLHDEEIPAALAPFAQPMLLPGENLKQYLDLRRLLIRDLKPGCTVEWLWTLDLIELSWESLRYRQLKHEALAQHRTLAIESLILKTEYRGIPAEASQHLSEHAQRAASDWSDDEEAAFEIEAYLKRRGSSKFTINMESFIQAESVFGLFEGLQRSTQARISGLLREMNLRRDFQRRASLAATMALHRRDESRPK